MKPTLLLAALSMVTAAPQSFGKSELETLRQLCKEQERQIRQLEEENALLRNEPASSSRTVRNENKPAAPVAGSTNYTVKPGDSFTRIARKFGTTPEMLAKGNGMTLKSIIRPGQTLKVPSAAARKADAAATASAPAAAAGGSHKVVQGETFSSISRKYNISTAALLAANPDVKPTELRPGQTVRLGGGPAPAPAARADKPAVAKAPQPQPKQAEVAKSTPPAPAPEPALEPEAPRERVHPITIEGEMTYGEFAAKHGTDAARLNELNGLDLTTATVLAKGSELYVPAQP